ncbi:hypothetical protein MNBD_GAMMA08-2508 [hydrothermal vent metagenome]|uniref:Endonuclease NucS C-terminal domain-containing protein n=1 Tax=hydrothermal vent metagenome TaxID=652676 RepID=A0A3B0XTC6_9ZZZZ
MDIERVKLHEVKELEPLVLSTLEQIEEGLKPLDNQISIGEQGRPDILAVDSDGSLAILELKSVPAGTPALEQVVRYYDWFSENISLISRPFPEINPLNSIRIFVIATEFNEEIVRLSKYLDLDISLIRVIPVKEKKKKDVGILYESIELERRDENISEFRSIEDIISYITDEKTKSEFSKVLTSLTEQGIELSPWKGGKKLWIECRHKGEDVGYLQTRRKFFRCQYYNQEKEEYIWPPVKCYTHEEWKSNVLPYFIESIKDA